MKTKLFLTFFIISTIVNAQVYKNSEAASRIQGASYININSKTQTPDNIKLSSEVSTKNSSAWLTKALNLTTSQKIVLLKEETDNLGFTCQRYQSFYKNIPIEGGVYLVHSKSGFIKHANGHFHKESNVNATASLKEPEAFNKALSYFNADRYIWEEKNIIYSERPKGILVILPINNTYVLCYKFDIFSVTPNRREYVYIDANSGVVAQTANRIHETDVVGTAETKYNGVKQITTDSYNGSFRLREAARGTGNGVETYNLRNSTSYGSAVDFTDSDNYWNTTTNQDNAAYDAHYGSEMVYDYYKTKFNRNSFDNAGAKLISYVHYSSGYVNAFWNGSYMTYGDGNGANYTALTSMDIVAHEITHAVTERTAGLVYSYESGALNESFSDIFGVVIDFYSNPGTANYLMGDQINTSGNGFRSMSNPNQYGHPDTYKGTNWYTGSGDNGGVHYNSGVQNYWFYLLTNGGSGTNDIGNVFNVSGIGMDKAAQIAYRTLTSYLTRNSQYADARTFSIQSAIDLFGACSAEEIAVTNAWYAVGVGASYNKSILADFSANINYSCTVPTTVQFTNSSLNATSYLWDFGDGSTSALANPSHIYTAAGSYTVSLTGYGSGQCGSNSNTKTKADYILINNQKSIADFSMSSANPAYNKDVYFTDLSTNSPTSWLWKFGDGSTSSLRNPSHKYLTSGLQNVTLISYACGNSDTIVKSLTVQNAPAISTTPSSLSATVNSCSDSVSKTFSINNSGGGDLTWQLHVPAASKFITCTPNSGTINSSSSNAITVKLKSTGLNSGTYIANVSIISNDPAKPTIVLPCTLVVAGSPKIALNKTCLNYGSLMAGTSAKDSILISNIGCDTLKISSIVASPSVFTVSPASGKFAPGKSGYVKVIFVPSAVASYTGTLTFHSNVNDTVVCLTGTGKPPLIVSVATTNALCNGSNTGSATANITAGTTPLTYLWSTGSTTQTITGLVAGNYSVTVTDALGSSVTAIGSITQPAAILVITAVNNASCTGADGSISLNVSGGTPAYKYNWSNGATAQNISGLSIGTYTVIVTDANGCSTPVVTPVIINSSSQGTWAQKTNFAGLARWGASSFSIGTKGYIGTGYNGTDMNDLWEWDQASNSWTQKATMPASARRGSIGFAIGNKGYIGTGVKDGPYFFNDLWEYDPSLNKWTQKASIPTTGFYGAAGFSIGNKGYVVSGNEGSASGPYSNKLWEYDPSSDTWLQKANFPGPARYGVRGYGTSLKGYFGMGGAISQSQYVYYKDFWEYTPSLNTWNQLPNYPGKGSGYVAGFAMVGKIYVGTGHTGGTPYSDFWEFDPSTVKWTQKANYGGGNRWLVTGFSIGNKGYFGTGYDFTNHYNDFWEFSPSNGCSPVVTVSTTNVLCNGGNTGSATANVTGGTAPYTYSWSNGATTQTITGLAAGNYSVTVTDAVGSSVTAIGSITQPAAISVITTVSNTSCSGADGSISVNVSGGAPGYMYNWNNGATTQNISGLSAGSYTVTVVDANGCSKTAVGSVVINSNAQGTWTQKANFGGTNRFWSVGFSIGSKGYIGTGHDGSQKKDFWEFDPSLNSWTQKADFAGTAREQAVGFSIGSKGYIGAGGVYPNGPYYQDFWEWDQSSNIWTQIANFPGAGRVFATGFSIGSKGYVGLGRTSGAGGFMKDFWEWDQSSNVWVQKANFGGTGREGASSFSIGTKGYIGTGNDGNVTQDFWEWNQATNVWTQKSNFSGVARYTGIGFSIDGKGYIGTGANLSSLNRYNDFWKWDPITNVWTQVANYGEGLICGTTGFAIGNKAYVGTGGSNTTVYRSFWEFSPSTGCSPVVTVSKTNVLCNGSSNGSATANVTGGTVPYNYLWSTGSTTQTISGLVAGNYSVTVTDALGSSVTAIGSITQPAAISVITTVSNASCSGADGSIALNVGGGTPGYMYNWSNGATTQNISGLSAGNYTVTVTDGNGCSKTENATVSVVDTIPPIAVCKNIVLQLDSSGNATIVAFNLDGGSSDACGIASLAIDKSSFNCSNIGNNNVALTVTDKSGNTSTCTAFVNVEDHIAPTITCPLDIHVMAQPNDCTPVVTWNTINASDNCSALVSSNHHSGDHFPVGTNVVIYTAVDPSGNSANCSFNVIVTPAPLTGTVTATNMSCSGSGKGSAMVNVLGGCIPYIYAWNTSPVQTAATATGLSAGTYSVKVTDANGTSITSTVTITQTNSVIANAGSNKTVYYGYSPSACALLNGSASGGIAPYKYSWSTGATAASIKVCPSSGEQYTLTVTDTNGCVATGLVKVCVVDVRCSKRYRSTDGKIEICHRLRNGKRQTLCVAASAVPAHLAHGDYLGACGTVSTCVDSKSGEQEDNLIIGDEINLTSYPNPFFHETTIRFNAVETGQVEVAVYNVLGVKVATIFNGTINGLEIHEEIFNAENLSNGIYFVKLITEQGEMKVERVVLNR